MIDVIRQLFKIIFEFLSVISQKEETIFEYSSYGKFINYRKAIFGKADKTCRNAIKKRKKKVV